MASIDALRGKVKDRLSLSADFTKFDLLINNFIVDSVDRLYPYAAAEVDEQYVEDFSIIDGSTRINLSELDTPLDSFRGIEYSTDGSEFFAVDGKKVHGNILTIYGIPSDAVSIRIEGLNPFTLETLPAYLQLGVVYYACAEFFNYMLGNKSQYNVYMNAAGSRSVDNMQDMATYYENKADTYIADRATVYGY